MKAHILLIILSVVFGTSCASYVQSVHKQISQEQRAQKMARQRKHYGPYGAYRGVPLGANDARPIKDPVTLGQGPSTASRRNVQPRNQRNYGKKRVQVDDLKDNSNTGSLWSGRNSESFLFVTNNVKRKGDIVIIDVLKDFKSNITSELKTAFPDRRRVAKKSASKEESKEKDPITNQNKKNEDSGGKKVYDKISTQVIEEINKDYLLIRGRKEILYKKAKRFIEVQAIVSRKDITDNDTVKSDKMLEPKVMVLRY